jgi:hypothetical protein
VDRIGILNGIFINNVVKLNQIINARRGQSTCNLFVYDRPDCVRDRRDMNGKDTIYVNDYIFRPLTKQECVTWRRHGLPLTPPSNNLPPPLYAEWSMDHVAMEVPWLLPDTDLPLPICTLMADPQKYAPFLTLRYDYS